MGHNSLMPSWDVKRSVAEVQIRETIFPNLSSDGEAINFRKFAVAPKFWPLALHNRFPPISLPDGIFYS